MSLNWNYFKKSPIFNGLYVTFIFKVTLDLRVRRAPLEEPHVTKNDVVDDVMSNDYVTVTVTKRQGDKSFGFSLKFDKNSTQNSTPCVGVVTPNTPAALAGLKVNDTIFAVNDKNVAQAQF